MADKPQGKSTQRNRLARIFLNRQIDQSSLFARLTVLNIIVGLGVSLLVTWLLVGFQFQGLVGRPSIPEYGIGDIADRDITAPRDFTVEDREATLQKEEETRRIVPAVFDLDLTVNNGVEAELRSAFKDARRLISEEKIRLGIPDSGQLRETQTRGLVRRLQEMLPRFDQGDILEIYLKHSFSLELENQLVSLVQEAMKPPGLVLSRDVLFPHRQSGMILRNTITGQDEDVDDGSAIRDLGQARDVLRQNEYQLTVVSAVEKKQIISFLDGWIIPNVRYNQIETTALEQLAVQEVAPVLILFKRGRIVVRAGDEITAREVEVLEQLERLGRPRDRVGKFAGIFLIISFFLIATWHYFAAYERPRDKIHSNYLLFTVVLVSTLFMAWLVYIVAGSLDVESLQDPLNFYFLAPVALGAILLVLLVDVEVSILYSLVFAVCVGLLTGEMGMVIYSLAGSLAAIYLMSHYRERTALIKGGIVLGLVNVLTVTSLELYGAKESVQWTAFLVQAGGGLLSGISSAMLASLLLPILESLFKITTDIRLLELSNLNNPILRRLAVEAPGTHHHSIMVGTLAEAAAEAIGANTLLVRVGAYYHDIGKLKTPEYYVENQIYASNKHEKLSASMSSLILANHVKDGLAMAEEIKLAQKVRDLIPQHHGTRLMTYFYQKAKEKAEEKGREVDETDFRYPGPKPQTKEAAILMMADQVEAAARTLQEPSPSQIRSLIRRLIQSTIQDRQFDECDITLKDLDRILRAFERVITGMHHHRIEYPGFDFNKQVEEEIPQGQRIQ